MSQESSAPYPSVVRPPSACDGIAVHTTEKRIEVVFYRGYDLGVPVRAAIDLSIPHPSWSYKRLRKNGERDRRCGGWSGGLMPERVRIRVFGCDACWDRSRGYDHRTCDVVHNGGCKCECHKEIARWS